MADEADNARRAEERDRAQALHVDARRRALEQPKPTGALALCRAGCGYMIEEARIRHGFAVCASCAAEAAERSQQGGRHGYAGGTARRR